MKTTLLLVVLASALALGMAACPNHCSGRGTCGSDDVCSCYSRYQGPDCSERKCKMNIAWVDGDRDTPHEYAECANRGVCDRESGECVCQDAFDGAGCQRLKCPNACSGHGTCEYIGDLGTYASSSWDATKVQGCKCDGGWEGYDCSERMCPMGDDPLTIHDPSYPTGDLHTISVRSADVASRLAGNAVWIVEDLYGTWETSRPFDVSSAAEAKAALEDTDIVVALDTLTVSDYDVTGSGRGYTYAIRLSNPAHVNNIAIEAKACDDAGCYGKRAMSVAKDPTAAPVVSIDVTNMALKEAAVCSNRGLCDRSTGICQCFEGHTGLACETQTILV
jgi:hypothetical protein